MIGRTCIGLLVGSLALVGGCRKAAPEPTAPAEPAHVEQHVEENDLNRITLTPRTEQRLGIQLADVELRSVQRKRQFGGEIMLPPGKSIIVSAPIAGTLSAPSGTEVPVAGQKVQAGQAMFTFEPMLTPERDVLTPSERVRVAQSRADVVTLQIEAQRQIESAKIQVGAARVAFDRAVQLLHDGAGSQRTVDETQANLKLAEEALKTAEARYEFLSSVQLDEEAGVLTSRDITAPVGGILQDLNAAVGETVTAGDTLFTIITTNRVWVRVGVYVGLWRAIDADQPGLVGEYGQGADEPLREAQLVSAPPSANPNAATVDVYYELSNEDAALVPGQVVRATVPFRGHAESLVVPRSAILYDIHGGAWVYQLVDEHVYARRRVAVDYVDGDTAVLASGPEPGSRVVTDGAVELFGTEFGVGH